MVRDDVGGLLLALPLDDRPAWELRWNHSVTGILVRDLFRWDGERVLLAASHQPAFDAGLGHIPGRGRLESDGAGGYWIRDIEEPIRGNRYALRVGQTPVDHRLVHAGASHSLSAMAAGQRVWIGVERR